MKMTAETRKFNNDFTKEMLMQMPAEKKEQLHKAMQRGFYFTTYAGLDYQTVEVYKEGWYIILEGCQTAFKMWVGDDDGCFVYGKRKPNKNKLSLLHRYSTDLTEKDLYDVVESAEAQDSAEDATEAQKDTTNNNNNEEENNTMNNTEKLTKDNKHSVKAGDALRFSNGDEYTVDTIIDTGRSVCFTLTDKRDGKRIYSHPSSECYGAEIIRSAETEEDTNINNNEMENDNMNTTNTTESKALTYEEFIALAKKNYNNGGSSFVECWEDYQFADYVRMFGPVTEEEALSMFRNEYDNETEQCCDEEEVERINAVALVEEITEAVTQTPARSAWARGVKEYALEMLEDMAFNAEHGYLDSDSFSNSKMLMNTLLNGADDWNQYSWGGSALIYDGDIAKRLCNASELKKTRNGERKPNSSEEWLDTQARALGQAARLIINQVCFPVGA